MSSGRILVAEHSGVDVIRLVGDVRLNLCLSFDKFIASMFGNPQLHAVVFDLREVEGIDSTTLGLMAKISIGAKQRGLENPLVVTGSASIRRLLVSMGFEDIFDFVTDKELPEATSRPIQEVSTDENAVREKVIEAHKILMEIYQPNQVKFKELIETLGGTGC